MIAEVEALHEPCLGEGHEVAVDRGPVPALVLEVFGQLGVAHGPRQRPQGGQDREARRRGPQACIVQVALEQLARPSFDPPWHHPSLVRPIHGCPVRLAILALMAEREPIFHITERLAWDAAAREGIYRAPSLESEGFIHLSTRAQVIPTANLLFRGTEGLVLLEVDPSRLSAELRFEAPAGPAAPGVPDRFPHLYGPLEAAAVMAVHELSPGPEGAFTWPPSSQA